jgi:hypothetical protein
LATEGLLGKGQLPEKTFFIASQSIKNQPIKILCELQNQKAIPGEKLLRGVPAAKLVFFPEFPASKEVSEP